MKIEELKLHAQNEDSHWWCKARREMILSQLERFVPSGCGKLVAEIGCGAGGNLKFLKDYYNVLGTDISPVAIEYTRERVGCLALLGDFREVLIDRWKDIDAVVLADVLEHIDDDAGFMTDLIASMKPASVLVIAVPAHMSLWGWHDIILGHRRRYSDRLLRSLWRDLDAEELFFSPFNCLLFPAIALHKLLKIENGGGESTELLLPSPWINRILYNIFSTERSLMKFVPLPFGISYMAVLRKKESKQSDAIIHRTVPQKGTRHE